MPIFIQILCSYILCSYSSVTYSFYCFVEHLWQMGLLKTCYPNPQEPNWSETVDIKIELINSHTSNELKENQTWPYLNVNWTEFCRIYLGYIQDSGFVFCLRLGLDCSGLVIITGFIIWVSENENGTRKFSDGTIRFFSIFSEK